MQNNTSSPAKTPGSTGNRVNDPKLQKQPDNASKRVDNKDRPNDGDVANPVDASDVPHRPANEAAATESWGAKQARQARENERAMGQGKPEPHEHD